MPPESEWDLQIAQAVLVIDKTSAKCWLECNEHLSKSLLEFDWGPFGTQRNHGTDPILCLFFSPDDPLKENCTFCFGIYLEYFDSHVPNMKDVQKANAHKHP